VVGSQSCSLNSTTGAWACTSDRDAKEGFTLVDGREVLARLAELPIASWSFRGADPAVRHLGPTAQDFHPPFGAGVDDKTISSLDADGVALAAIQGLYRVAQEKDAQLASLQQQSSTQQEQIAALREQNVALEARLQAVEQKLGVSEVGAVPSGPSLPSSWPLLGGLALAGLAVGPRLRRG
jgi:trimeric autotransporter adhesin